MTLKNILKYIATPSKIFTTAVIILFAIFIVQLFTIQMSSMIHARAWERISRQTAKEPKKELTEEEIKLEIMTRSEKEFLPDGTIFYTKQKSKKKDFKIYDEDVNILWQGPKKKNPYDFIPWPETILDSRRYNRLHHYKTISPELSRSIQVPVRTKEKIQQMWQYNWEKGYFEGFDPKGGNIGYLGSTGFTQTRANATPLGTLEEYRAWCPDDSYSPTLLWLTKRKIYQINFEKQKLELLIESPDSDIKATAWHNWKFPKEKSTHTALPAIQCSTEDRTLYIRTKDTKKTVSVKVPQNWQKKRYSMLSATKAGIFLTNNGTNKQIPEECRHSQELLDQWRKEIRKKPTHRWAELYKVDDQGNLELIKRKDWTTPPPKDQPRRAANNQPEKVKHYVCSFSPAIYDFPWKIWGTSLRKKLHANDDLSTLIAQITHEVRPHSSKLSWVLTIVMMLLVFLHAWPRRTTWHRLIFWVIFAAVFNLAGLLTYLALNHTTVIKCPACKKRRGLERTDCIRCTTELPTPEKRKTDLILHA